MQEKQTPIDQHRQTDSNPHRKRKASLCLLKTALFKIKQNASTNLHDKSSRHWKAVTTTMHISSFHGRRIVANGIEVSQKAANWHTGTSIIQRPGVAKGRVVWNVASLAGWLQPSSSSMHHALAWQVGVSAA